MLETLTTVLRKVICKRQWKITEQYLLVKVIMTATNGSLKAFAFVEMENDAAAAKAMAELERC